MPFPSSRIAARAVLLMALALAGCSSARPPQALSSPTGAPRGFALFLQHHFESKLSEIDPVTSADIPGRQGIGLPGGVPREDVSIVASDTSPVLAVTGHETTHVLKLDTGATVGSFARPDLLQIRGVSPDGTRLIGFTSVEGREQWRLLDAASGEVRMSGAGCCAVFDWSGRRVYSLLVPGLAGAFVEPGPAVLLVTDLLSGGEIGRLTLEGVQAGSARIEDRRNGQTMQTSFGPGMALSADGRTLALLHADADRLTLVDAVRLVVTATRDISGSADALRPGAAIRHWQSSFAPDGRLYLTGAEERLVVEQDGEAVRYLGVRVVDVGDARVTAEALIGEDWGSFVLAPDASAIYFSGGDPTATPVPGMPPRHPTLLRRLSLPDLAVTADRRFDSSYRPIAVGR